MCVPSCLTVANARSLVLFELAVRETSAFVLTGPFLVCRCPNVFLFDTPSARVFEDAFAPELTRVSRSPSVVERLVNPVVLLDSLLLHRGVIVCETCVLPNFDYEFAGAG